MSAEQESTPVAMDTETPVPAESEEKATEVTEVVVEKTQEQKEAEHLAKKLADNWLAVEKDTNNFEAWTQLVGLVEKNQNLDEIRKVLGGLLKTFPLCFGYWKRWSIHEKRAGNDERSIEILDQGLEATPHSLQLWLHTASVHLEAKNTEKTRAFFEKALEATGLDYGASPLLKQYLTFEEEEAKKGNNYILVMHCFLRSSKSLCKILRSSITHLKPSPKSVLCPS